MTKGTLAHLDRIGVPYEYIDIDKNTPGRQWVASQNGGKEKKPTLDINGQVLTEPSNRELDAALEAQGIEFQRA